MLPLLSSLLVLPLLALLIDVTAHIRAGLSSHAIWPGLTISQHPLDYTVVVPIYGDIRYLENIDYLDQYGSRVLLATGATEDRAFYRDLTAIAIAHGFRIHIAKHQPSAAELRHTGRRAVGGTLRDIIVRDAHDAITSEYIVCIDADTRSLQSLDVLVDQFARSRFDLASVRLQVANRRNLLTKLQGHEYNMAMKLRTIMPWLVSGACHIARSSVHRTLMHRHSLFFQGNDVELGLLAYELGYRVGHIPFVVPTDVPETVRGWLRQRRAWAGGEFRLVAVNIRLSRRHPFLYLYGLIIVIGALPFRLYYVGHPSWSLVTVLALYYVAVMAINWRSRDGALLLYPFYALVHSLILVPIGIFAYFSMAIRYRNAGIIRPGRRPEIDTSPYLPGALPDVA